VTEIDVVIIFTNSFDKILISKGFVVQKQVKINAGKSNDVSLSS